MSNDKVRGEMSFLGHLEELRWAILKSVVALFVGMIVCFLFAESLLQFLLAPTRVHAELELQFVQPSGMFMARIYISLGCGFALVLPYVLYQIWNFISPGLFEHERKYIPHVIIFSTVLFLLGAAFAYYVLIPVLIEFFVMMNIEGVKAQWDIGYYIGLIAKMILLMGAVFQMPVVIGFLTWLRILTPGLLKRSWRYAMVIIFILAAVITPTGDPLTQTIVAVPLVFLYFLSILVSSLITRSRDKGKEEETPAPAGDKAPMIVPPSPPEEGTVSRRMLSDFTGPESGGPQYWIKDDQYDEYLYEGPDIEPTSRIKSDDPEEKDGKQNSVDENSNETEKSTEDAPEGKSGEPGRATGSPDPEKK